MNASQRSTSNHTTNATNGLIANYHIMVTCILVAIAILVINSMAVSVFRRRPSLLRTSSNKYLYSLALCDLLNGIICMMYIINWIVPCLNFRTCKGSRKLAILLDISTTFLANTSVLHICGLTFDRKIQICYALEYLKMNTGKICKRFILASWTVAFFSSFVQLSWLYLAFIDLKLAQVLWVRKAQAWYSAIILFLFLFCPLAFIINSYVLMYVEILRMEKQRRISIGRMFHDNAMQRRALYTYTIMFAMFLFLSVPYFTIRLLLDMSKAYNYTVHVSIEVTTGITLLQYVTSIMNPTLYMNKEYRRFILMKLNRWRRNRQSVTMSKETTIELRKLRSMSKRSHLIGIDRQQETSSSNNTLL